MITLDQRRAKYAWDKAREARNDLPDKDFEKYRNLAKGAPALVMGSGLMAALAFWQSRKEDPAKRLVRDLLGWKIAGETADFARAMTWLMKRSSAEYMAATDETLALLRWLRQCVDAVAEADLYRGNDEYRRA